MSKFPVENHDLKPNTEDKRNDRRDLNMDSKTANGTAIRVAVVFKYAYAELVDAHTAHTTGRPLKKCPLPEN